MTDRVPGAPGQYQAVITAEQQQKLSAGEPFVITLTRDDQPIVEGTPYSKNAVLPDTLAQALCPYREDPTPADALQALYERQLESDLYPGCYYRMADDEQEWLNPPMVAGEAYRTAERYNGRPVYIKMISLGAMDAGSQTQPVYKRSATGIDAQCILSWHATARRQTYRADTGTYATALLDNFPYVQTSDTNISGKLYFDYNSVVVTATGDLSDIVDVNLWIKYTKEPVME